VDGTEDRLASSGELAEERDDHERRLAVETRSRLVEEKKRRLGDELDADSKTLALLNTETSSRKTDNSVLEVTEFEEINDSVDILELLVVGDGAGLTKESGELEGLANSSLGKVHVELLAVAGGTLERERESLAIEENLAANLTLRLAGSENVHESGLGVC
jgi:hypothetical protein